MRLFLKLLGIEGKVKRTMAKSMPRRVVRCRTARSKDVSPVSLPMKSPAKRKQERGRSRGGGGYCVSDEEEQRQGEGILVYSSTSRGGKQPWSETMQICGPGPDDWSDSATPSYGAAVHFGALVPLGDERSGPGQSVSPRHSPQPCLLSTAFEQAVDIGKTNASVQGTRPCASPVGSPTNSAESGALTCCCDLQFCDSRLGTLFSLCNPNLR